MRDWLVTALAEYSRLPLASLSPDISREARRRVIDSVGVAIGAFDADGPTAVRRVAESTPVDGGARVWGANIRTTLESAVLANAAAVRYLDYNDAYFGADSTHPSDMIAGLVAVGETYGATGQQLLEAIAIGYEVAVTAADGFGARARGWDHVNGTALGAVCGAGRLMGLSVEELSDAIGITVVSHVAMGQSREGELTMWKGLAAPDAVRHAIYACRLAQAGVHGPQQPFEGRRGFIRLVLGGELLDRDAFRGIESGQPPARILDTHIKAWPLGIVAQSGVDAALRIHPLLTDLEDVESVLIETFKVATEVMGSPEKWRPTTRETADHSMAFVVASALRDGSLTAESFSLEKVTSPDMHAFLQARVKMREDPELTKGYPDGLPTRVVVGTRAGQEFVEEVTYYRGHARNPLSDNDLEEKYLSLAVPVLGEEDARGLLATLYALDAAEHLRGITDHLVR